MTALQLHMESIPEGEQHTIEEMVKQTLKAVKPIEGCIHRVQHPKATICARATFEILHELPTNLQFGIFSKPGSTFEAIVRFSNAVGDPSEKNGFQSDAVGTARGMALKLMIPGSQKTGEATQQDFLLMDHPIFPFPNPEAYLSTMSLKNLPLVGNLVAGAQLALLERDELAVLKDIRGKLVGSPLEIKYWSGTPFWLGASDQSAGQAVKYVIAHQQHSAKKPTSTANLPENYLRDVGYDFLKSNEAVFMFKVQIQTDPVAMPIENASIKWDEDVSDPIPVARIRIQIQNRDLDFEKQVENLQFNPWHCLNEHRPMGGMNRLRKAVYEASTASRLGGRCPR